MLQVGILLTEQYKLLSIAAILDVFETVNTMHAESGKPIPFAIQLLQQEDGFEVNNVHGYSPTYINADAKHDLILIPAFKSNDLKQAIDTNYQFLPWLQQQYKDGAQVASFCTGAFLLGASGLLDGKTATTHVDASNAFALAFPKVKLQADKTVTQDGRVFTSGGATSSFHLLLHLMHLHCGKEVAVRAAKIFAIDMDRDNQSYFGSFQPLRDHTDELVATAQQKIESNYHQIGTIEEMIKDIPASRRNMVRRFKQVIGITPIEYLQQTRMAAAKKLLEQTGRSMMEIIIHTGYNDPKAFRKVFRKTVGMTPTEYREKFQVN